MSTTTTTTVIIITATTMRDERESPRAPVAVSGFAAELMLWLSPSFPTGAFAYSQGLETAVASGAITGRADLSAWLTTLIARGALWSDIVTISFAFRTTAPGVLRDLADLSLALQPSAERSDETLVLARNFRKAIAAGWPELNAAFDPLADRPATYPLAVALAARARGIPLEHTLEAYAQAFVTNALSAAIRLAVVGQYDALGVHGLLAPAIRQAVAAAAAATEDDIATAAFAADIASMNHETLEVRLFRS